MRKYVNMWISSYFQKILNLKMGENKVSKQTIGFIGTGVMGKSMAAHLLKAGHPLHVYTRTKAKAEQLIQQGAIWENSVADVARAADVVITIIGTPKDVEDVYFGVNGI